ncbi:MAG: hypothetical protein WBW80_20150 [Acidimicrobiales bacterium]
MLTLSGIALSPLSVQLGPSPLDGLAVGLSPEHCCSRLLLSKQHLAGPRFPSVTDNDAGGPGRSILAARPYRTSSVQALS